MSDLASRVACFHTPICPRCDYSLVGLEVGARWCPECGGRADPADLVLAGTLPTRGPGSMIVARVVVGVVLGVMAFVLLTYFLPAGNIGRLSLTKLLPMIGLQLILFSSVGTDDRRKPIVPDLFCLLTGGKAVRLHFSKSGLTCRMPGLRGRCEWSAADVVTVEALPGRVRVVVATSAGTFGAVLPGDEGRAGDVAAGLREFLSQEVVAPSVYLRVRGEGVGVPERERSSSARGPS